MSLLVAGFYLLLGWGLCLRLRLPARGLEGFAWAYGVGTGSASLLLLGLVSSGLWGALVQTPFSGVLLVAAIAAAIGWPAIRALYARPRIVPPVRQRAIVPLLALLVFPFLVVRLMQGETGWDALAYHLPVAERFGRDGAGAMVGVLDGEFRIGFDILFMPGLTLDGSLPYGAAFAHVLATFALGAGVAAEAMRRTSRLVGIAVAGLFVLTPGILSIATHAYVDVGVGLYVFLALAAASRALREPGAAIVVAAGLFGGFAANAKLPAGVAIAAVAIAFLAGRGVRRGARDAALATGVALLVAAPWFVRAWINMGNPFFPALLDRFGSGWADREVVEATKRTVLDQMAVPRDLLLPLRGVHQAVFESRGGFEGPAWIVAFLPAALLRPDRDDRRGVVAGAVVLFLAWGAFVPLFRFGIGVWAWAAVAAAVGMARLARDRRLRPAVAVVLLAFVGIGSVAAFRFLWQPTKSRSTAELARTLGPAATYGRFAHVPPPTGLSSSFIALVPGQTISLEPQRNGRLRASDFDDADRLYAACRRAGLRSLLLDVTTVEGRKALAHAAIWTKDGRATSSMRAGWNGIISWTAVVFTESGAPR